jgi:stage III sporulation protein AD
MDVFWKSAAIVVLTVIFASAVNKNEKNLAVALSVTACCIVAIAALQNLSVIVDFLWKISNTSEYQHAFTGTLLKIAGVSLVSELVGMISLDAGNTALDKVMGLLGNTAVLSLSLPIFEAFFEIIQEILNIV